MKKLYLLPLALAAFPLYAADINVGPSDYISAYSAAADGDVLILSGGTYGTDITFPQGKSITFKGETGAGVKLAFEVRGASSLPDGGLVFENVEICRGNNYFITGDFGNISTIEFRDCKINNIYRCLLRTNQSDKTIDNISLENCVISDCGGNGYNFIYTKHGIKQLTVKNTTFYNYIKGESFFSDNGNSLSPEINVLFENNTFYRFAKDSSRSLVRTGNKYGAASNYIFRNNLVYKPGVDGQAPTMINATGGNLLAENNLIIEFGGYSVSEATSSSISDITLESLGVASLDFPDPDKGDFTILSNSPLATAGKGGAPIGDKRWIKTVAEPVDMTTSIYPENAGSVSPQFATYDKGEWVTVTAANNYGYRFAQWQDAAGNTLSEDNPYMFQINENIDVKAVFTVLDMYSLNIDKQGEGAAWGRIVLSPEPVDGKYEANTLVNVTVRENPVTSFLYWDDMSSEKTRTVMMDKDASLTASFDIVPFIVGWDLDDLTVRSNRVGDHFYQTDNQGVLTLFNGNGSETNWGGSTRTFGTRTINCARRYTEYADMGNPRYFRAKFKASGYENIVVKSLIAADNNCVHKTQKLQYSFDGVNYTDLKTVEMKINEWIEMSAALPADMTEEQKGAVYLRWIGDISTELLGNVSSSDTEGFYLANVFVFADEEIVEDNKAPVLISSTPSEGSNSASANGKIVLTFNEKVKAVKESVMFNGVEIVPVFGSKTVSFEYKGLKYGTDYTFTLPAGAISDMSGNLYPGVEVKFTTMVRPEPLARVFDAVLAKDGSGDYTSLQAAIDAMPANRTSPWLIFIKNGYYEELVRIPSNKPFIHLIGQDKEKVTIGFAINCSSSEADTGWEFNKGQWGMSDCSVIVSSASDFYAENITFDNRYGLEYQNGPMALAFKTNNDRFTFYNVRMRSYQDTWQTVTSYSNARHYIKNSHIEGAVDYVYGSGNVFIDECTLYNKRSGSVIVAPSHQSDTKYGYVFNNCIVDGDKIAKDGKQLLGRPWQNYPRAVFLNTIMKALPAPQGWTDMGPAPKLFAEYNSVDEKGNLIDLSNRRTWYTERETGNKITGLQAILSAEEAAEYSYENVMAGSDEWNPKAMFEPVNAPAELKYKGNVLTWSKSDYAISYVIYRGDSVIGFSKELSYTDASVLSCKDAVYTVRAVNEYGSLSASSLAAVEKIETSVAGVVSGKMNVTHSGDRLLVEVSDNVKSVSLIRFDGVTVEAKSVISGKAIFDVASLKGFYIVKAGDRSVKVIL